jgi:hypothetical protein
MKLLALNTPKKVRREEAKEVLAEAAETEFDSVIVLGLKGGEIHIKSSSNFSRLEIIGAVEVAKQHLWEAD